MIIWREIDAKVGERALQEEGLWESKRGMTCVLKAKSRRGQGDEGE